MACKKLFFWFFTFICMVQFIKTDYIAAVVEYQPINGTSPNETVESNLAQYIYNIEQAQRSSVQIIVFPEYGLTGAFVEPERYAIEIPNPGDNTTFADYWLQKLSNAAVAYSMYVVINLLEKSRDNDNNTIFYNTNIVFDKYGKLVAKYRKINLYEEPSITPGSPLQNQSTFTTDFGITFGTFICFDITFNNPAEIILSDPSVTDIVYPTAWYSILPFFHSISSHSGYALANKVNLLAANLNSIQNGIGGSGIYGADGTIFSYYISGSPGTKLQIATVKNAPKRDNATVNLFGFDFLDENVQTLVNFKPKRYFESEKYEFRRLNLSQQTIKEEVCHRYFCCVFTVNVSSTAVNTSEVYQIMAYKGLIRVGGVKDVKICSLVACQTTDLNSCGERDIKLTTRLESVLVETNMPDEPGQYYVPFSLTGDLVPVFNAAFNSTVSDGDRTYKYSKYSASNIKQQNVIAFGIMGNNSVALGVNSVLLAAIFFLNYLFH